MERSGGGHSLVKYVKRREWRIVLYSHDTMGLGHMRRNLIVAHMLASSGLRPVILTIVGKTEARRFPLPPRSDRLILPALRKRADGSYEPRSLGVPTSQLIDIRSRVIEAAVDAFAPDLLIVDNIARGAMKELDRTLALVRRLGGTKVVLGLRDVLDSPDAVRREWTRAGNLGVIRRNYDQVWIYGDRSVFDSTREYRFPADIIEKTRFTGYFDQRVRLQFTPAEEYRLADSLGLDPAEPTALCLLGGGQDGAALATAFSRARLPEGWNGVIVAGPYLPERVRRSLHERQAADSRFRVLDFIPEPAVMISRADRIVAMGGYNTVWEILSFGKPSLIVPRVHPRAEQLIRAERLRELGLLDVLHPDRLTAGAISDWLRSPQVTETAVEIQRVDLTGLSSIPQFVAELLGSRLAGRRNVRQTELETNEGGVRRQAVSPLLGDVHRERDTRA